MNFGWKAFLSHKIDLNHLPICKDTDIYNYKIDLVETRAVSHCVKWIFSYFFLFFWWNKLPMNYQVIDHINIEFYKICITCRLKTQPQWLLKHMCSLKDEMIESQKIARKEREREREREKNARIQVKIERQKSHCVLIN